VEGKLEGKTMNMIVDTGSNISIVAPQLLRNIGKDLSCVQPVPNCLKSVTGEKLNLLGAVTLKFEIGNREILQSFYVADISESCILGLDFLQQQRCQLNITNGILSMGNVQVPLLHPLTDDLDMLCYRVIALEDINIQPHSKSGWGVIEPADEEPIPGVLLVKF
jgi:predicted aspartyl protease